MQSEFHEPIGSHSTIQQRSHHINPLPRCYYSLWLQDPQTLVGHAVDAPLVVAVVIADGDREPAVISADQVDVAPLAALDCQCLALARVRRLVLGRCKKTLQQLLVQEASVLVLTAQPALIKQKDPYFWHQCGMASWWSQSMRWSRR